MAWLSDIEVPFEEIPPFVVQALKAKTIGASRRNANKLRFFENLEFVDIDITLRSKREKSLARC